MRPGILVFVIAGAAIILSAQASERRWLAGDSHVHSHWSPGYDRTGDTPRVIKGRDAIYSTPQNASMAERFGLSWMVTTDHGGPNHAKFNATQAYAELAESRELVPGILQFYGMELNMPGMDHQRPRGSGHWTTCESCLDCRWCLRTIRRDLLRDSASTGMTNHGNSGPTMNGRQKCIVEWKAHQDIRPGPSQCQMYRAGPPPLEARTETKVRGHSAALIK